MVPSPLLGELVGAEHAEGGAGSVAVVLASPVGHPHLDFEQGIELLDGEQLVTQAGAVGLHPGVLPR